METSNAVCPVILRMVLPNEKLSKIPLGIHIGKDTIFNYLGIEAGSVFYSNYYITTLWKEGRLYFILLRHTVYKGVSFCLGVSNSTHVYQSTFLVFIFTVVVYVSANILLIYAQALIIHWNTHDFMYVCMHLCIYIYVYIES